jgi:glycosyltransferase involved in cell wall biosynthesis
MQHSIMKVAIIVPCWNEEFYLKKTLKNIRSESTNWTIIVSDDGSTDKSQIIAKKYADYTLTNKHVGKGSTARKGCDFAVKKGFDTLVLIDADGQHQPKDIHTLIKLLEKKDIIFTYRIGSKQPTIFKIGNWGLNIITWLLFGIWIKDSQSGFRAFTKQAYKQIRWKAESYDMESEMLAKAKGLRYSQIPIKKIYLDNNKGTTVLAGLKLAGNLILRRIGL